MRVYPSKLTNFVGELLGTGLDPPIFMKGYDRLVAPTIKPNQSIFLSAFRDRGVPGPTSEMSLRAPAQMGRREAEREGGRKVAGDERERGGNPAAFVFVPHPGRVRLQ
jgi:hypothetical protein